MDNLSDIAVFVRVVDAGSFTSAADKLGLSQSAVSKCVTRLEDAFSARLLNRSTRRWSLTEAGEALYSHGKKALAELHDAEIDITRLQTEPRGLLRVNAPMSFGILHIAPLIPDFLARYPALDVDMQMDDRLVDILEEGFDVAIRIKPLADSTLIAKRLAPCRQLLCAAPAYLQRAGRPATPEALASHDFLIYTYRDTPRELKLRAPDMRVHSVSIKGRYRGNSGLAARELAVHGSGILAVPSFYIGDDLRDGRLVTVLDGYTLLPELSVFAVYPARRHLSPKVWAFVDFLSEHYGPVPYWDAPR
jgi:DNA-binding transcriptional LysR family regulator